MSNGNLAKVTAKTAAEIFKHFSLGEEAKKLVKDNQSPRQALDLLIEKQQFLDAVRLLAFALPKRETVWWACQCIKSVAGPTPNSKFSAACQAAEKWAADPSEPNRRSAQTAAEAAGYDTPAGCTAAAAFWSGGSLGPPNVPVIPPGELLTAQGAVGAIMLAAVEKEPEKAPEKCRKFLTLGIDVANGANKWK